MGKGLIVIVVVAIAILFLLSIIFPGLLMFLGVHLTMFLVPAILVIALIHKVYRYFFPSVKSHHTNRVPTNQPSRFLRKGLRQDVGTEKYYYHGKAGEMTLPSKGRIFLDSSTALKIMGGATVPDALAERLAITATVRREIDGVSRNNPGYDSKLLPCYDKPVKTGTKFSHYLKEIDHIHSRVEEYKAREAMDPSVLESTTMWLKTKQRYLSKTHEIEPQHIAGATQEAMGGHGLTLNPQSRKAIALLYYAAEKDRKIMAEAASQAGTGAALVSSDGDMLAFHKEIAGLTVGRLRVVNTDALIPPKR